MPERSGEAWKPSLAKKTTVEGALNLDTRSWQTSWIYFSTDLTVPHLPPPPISLLNPQHTSVTPTPHHPLPLPAWPIHTPHSLPLLSQQESLHGPINTPSLSITADQVRRELRRTKARKAIGPDGINSRLLKDCADQLCGVLLHMFNLSLSLERVPLLWKTSCMVPVPKTVHPQGAQPLQASGFDLSPYENHGEDRSHPPSTLGEQRDGPSAVCLSTWHWCGWRCHLPAAQVTFTPGEHWEHCESHVFWLLQYFQHNRTITA